MSIDDNNKYKNKLNIKDDLQNYWEKEEKKEKVNDNIKIDSYINNDLKEENKEMPINNEWTKNKNFNMNYNNDENENKSKSTLIILALITIVIIVIYNMYNQEQKEIQKQNEIDKETLKNIKEKKLEEQRALNSQNRQQNQTYNQNYNNYKYFKIKYESDRNYDHNFIYNMSVITSNLSSAKSRSNDNNYDIEIVGHLSKYGGLFYRIDKRKTSNEYDNEISSILSELKKIKFRLQEDTVNFKIYVNNNSMDLN